jgi:mRNA interferase MazF
VFLFQVLLDATATGLAEDSKAQAEQVRSVSVDRVTVAIGLLPPPLMDELDDALRLHLSL